MDESDKVKIHELVDLAESCFLIYSINSKVGVATTINKKIDRVRLSQELLRLSAFLNEFGGAVDIIEV